MLSARTLALAAAALLAGCGSPERPPDVVARVGEAYLGREEIEGALAGLPPGLDSATARQQFVEQWVTTQLMAQAAEARGLREDPEVRRQLAESERAVLAAAFVGALYEEQEGLLSRADLEAYFEQNRERLALREPYVRVRFIETRSPEAAAEARAALEAATSDSLWIEAASTFAADTAASLALARQYVPEARLARAEGASPWQALGQLEPGQTSPVLEADSTSFLTIQLVDRRPAGSIPELAWIEEEILHRLAIQARKQLVARQVARLRAEAEARHALVLPDDPAP